MFRVDVFYKLMEFMRISSKYVLERVLKERVPPPKRVVVVPTQITDFFLISTFDDIQLFIPMSTFYPPCFIAY